MIPVARPEITDKEREYVNDVLDSRVLSRGRYTQWLEEMFADYFGVPYALACSSGTMGLYVVLQAIDWISGNPDKHVVISDETFGATMNAVAMCGERWEIESVTQYETSNSTEPDIYIPCHVFGTVAPDFADAWINAKYVVEDACEAIGAEFESQWLGTIGDAGVFGFYPNKQIVAGEGGMIITSNESIYEISRNIINQGRGDTGPHEMAGTNARISELQAAVCLAQMERLDEILYVRQGIAQDYMDRLNRRALGDAGFLMPHKRDSWFAFPLTCQNPDTIVSLQNHLKNAGIQSAIYFPECKPYPQFVHSKRLCIPFYNEIQTEDIDVVCREINAWAERHANTIPKKPNNER